MAEFAAEQVMQALRARLDTIPISPLTITEEESPGFSQFPFIHIEQGNLEADSERGTNSTRVFMDITLTLGVAVNPGDLLRTEINRLAAEVQRIIEADVTLGGLAYLTWLRNGVADIGTVEGGPRQIVYTSEWQADFAMPLGDPYTIASA